MEKLLIENTKATPLIEFDPNNNTLLIKGQSYPENAFQFYEPVLLWLEQYLANLTSEAVITFDLHLPYINTSSSKCIMMILEKMQEAYEEGKKLSIRWHYDSENEAALECAEEFKEDLSLPFEIIAVEAGI